MTAGGLSIEMLPARHGDALWIEWGEPQDRHRMLIDGGPAAAADEVRQRIGQLAAGDRCFDLMIVTHIDLDHIAGAIELLEDDSLGIEYGDVWFNDFRHLSDEPPTRGALQGEYLSGLLSAGHLPWNKAFDGGAVRVAPNGVLPRVSLEAGLSLVLLSPPPDKLLELRDDWIKTLEKAKQKEEERAAEEEAETTRGGRAVFGADRSKANGSSIALIAEYQDERWLLAGDAHADVLLAGLQRYGKQVGEDPVRLDGFKLPHHGSARNITPALLAAIDCRRFLVSTNGAYFKHPDRECLDLIVGSIDRPELVFNYHTEFTEPWAEPSDAFTASFSGTASETGQRTTGDDPGPALPSWAQEAAPSETPVDAEPSGDGRSGGADDVETAPHSERPTVKVRMFHGSLERAAHPVLVGHYRATPLSGAEGFVDRRFGRRLSDRLAVDRYPGDIGESLLIEAPRHKHPQRGVLVVGLGEYGELTPNRLVETIRAALVRYALNQADRRDVGGTLELGISSVLLGGTGEQGLSISSSVRAVLDGVCEANRGLFRSDGGPRATFTELELWERNAPEAEVAYRSFDERSRTVWSGPGASVPTEYVPPDDLDVADGAMHESLPVEVGDRRWWRVRVADCSDSAPDEGPPSHLQLEFTVGGRLARTGTVLHRVERRRLERILGDAVGKERPAEGIHTTLFELLFPNQLKWDLMAAQDIQLEVDDTTADIPWEMLEARNPEQGERGQLALRAPLVRQLRLPDVPSVRRSNKPSALVIGNPPVGSLAPTLPGAFAEAASVGEVLEQGGYKVLPDLCFDTDQRPDDATTLAIETALFADDYRIIHIAAHGFYQPDDPTRTGIAIGPDDFLTASVFRQMNVIPDVVFLNCCHLGNVAGGVASDAFLFTRRHLNQLGASLARELISGGVRAVVVAGWAVQDQAASAFARTFYGEMLGGQTFGWAVHNARRAAWHVAPDHSTWGAYQCYGDGGYALPTTGAHQRDLDDVSEPRTVREARRWLDAIINRIASVGIEPSSDIDRAQTAKELKAIERAAEERSWAGDGQLCERIAGAHKALGDFERAVEWYERALRADDGAMTLAGVEQLANLRDRLAASLTRNRSATEDDRRRAATLIEESMEAIELLEKLSPLGERVALRAGHHKRRATATTGSERLAAVDQAATCYLAAYRKTGEPYALFNYVQLESIRSRIAGDTPAIDEVVDDLQRHLDEDDTSTYWHAVARPDGQLTTALVEDAVDASHDTLVQSYSAAFDNRSTWAQRASTLDHLLDLAELHPDAAQKDALTHLHDELSSIS